jgi:hypothetical protein
MGFKESAKMMLFTLCILAVILAVILLFQFLLPGWLGAAVAVLIFMVVIFFAAALL